MAEFNELLGKTIVRIDPPEVKQGQDVIRFHCSDGDVYTMTHVQDCCESVLVEDINGDLNDLLNSPVVLANEVFNSDRDYGTDKYIHECFTWTFYRIGTIRGTVVIRWLGSSNGYYSERVDFIKTSLDTNIRSDDA